MNNNKHVAYYNSSDTFYEAVASHFIKRLQTKIADLSPIRRVNVAISGGSTPLAIWERIRRQYLDAVDWQQVNIFWVDERYVSLKDKQSNYYHAHHLLYQYTTANLFPYPVNLPLHQAASNYEQTLQKHVPITSNHLPSFDLIWLGMGADGHIASLFPTCPDALKEQRRWVIGMEVPGIGPRLSLTLPVLGAAKERMWVIGGQQKIALLENAPHRKPPKYPVDFLLQNFSLENEYFFLYNE